jgi:hypothetical protein
MLFDLFFYLRGEDGHPTKEREKTCFFGTREFFKGDLINRLITCLFFEIYFLESYFLNFFVCVCH